MLPFQEGRKMTTEPSYLEFYDAFRTCLVELQLRQNLSEMKGRGSRYSEICSLQLLKRATGSIWIKLHNRNYMRLSEYVSK